MVLDYPSLFPINPCAIQNIKPAHAKGLNVVYADCHAAFSPFGSQTNGSLWEDRPAHPCYYDWGADHGWQGYFE